MYSNLLIAQFKNVLNNLKVFYPEIAKDIFERFTDDHPIVGDERITYQTEILFEEHKNIFQALYSKVTTDPENIPSNDCQFYSLHKRPPEGTNYAYSGDYLNSHNNY